MFLKKDILNHGPYYQGPFVLWVLDPTHRIMTIRPSWDLTRSLVLPYEFPDQYYKGLRLQKLAKELKELCFYPSDQQIIKAVRRIWVHFMNGGYIYPGRNVVIDPWYFRGDKCIEINFFRGTLVEFPDLCKFPKRNSKK